MLMMTGRLPGNFAASGRRGSRRSPPSKLFQRISCGSTNVAVLRPAVSDSVQRSTFPVVMSSE
jgi:hypothetical protein